jgi:putative acetyltransferase
MDMTEDQKYQIQIRNYHEQDARALADIYFNTIHTINAQDYTKEQRDVWAPSTSLELEGWQKKWAQIPPLVAIVGDVIVGFTEFEDNGHIDCFYCHHEWIGKGVGSALMRAIETQAFDKGIDRIYAEVSITAKPFFESKGFEVVRQQSIQRKGIELTNFVMEKVSRSKSQ